MRSGVPSTVVPAWITLEPDLLTAAAFTFWGHCGEYIRDDDLIYKHCVCGACKYTGLIIAVWASYYQGNYQWYSKYNQNVWLSYEIFLWLPVHLIEVSRAAGMPLPMSYFLVLAGCAVCTCPAPAPPPAWAAGGSSSGPKMQSQVVTRMSSSPVLSRNPRNVELLLILERKTLKHMHKIVWPNLNRNNISESPQSNQKFEYIY